MISPSVVYYVRFEEFVKIGTSRNLPQRMATVGGHELLAVEPGDHALEHMRHLEFEHLRFRGEWFYNEPPLSDLIQRIRSTLGTPTEAYKQVLADTHSVLDKGTSQVSYDEPSSLVTPSSLGAFVI